MSTQACVGILTAIGLLGVFLPGCAHSNKAVDSAPDGFQNTQKAEIPAYSLEPLKPASRKKPSEFSFIVGSLCRDPWRATVVASDDAHTPAVLLREGREFQMTMRVEDVLLFTTPAGGIIPFQFGSKAEGEGVLLEVAHDCSGVTTVRKRVQSVDRVASRGRP